MSNVEIANIPIPAPLRRRRRQPHLDQMQRQRLDDSPGYAMHQLGVRDRVEGLDDARGLLWDDGVRRGEIGGLRSGARMGRLKEPADIAMDTPDSEQEMKVSLLRSFDVPAQATVRAVVQEFELDGVVADECEPGGLSQADCQGGSDDKRVRGGWGKTE